MKFGDASLLNQCFDELSQAIAHLATLKCPGKEADPQSIKNFLVSGQLTKNLATLNLNTFITLTPAAFSNNPISLAQVSYITHLKKLVGCLKHVEFDTDTDLKAEINNFVHEAFTDTDLSKAEEVINVLFREDLLVSNSAWKEIKSRLLDLDLDRDPEADSEVGEPVEVEEPSSLRSSANLLPSAIYTGVEDSAEFGAASGSASQTPIDYVYGLLSEAGVSAEDALETLTVEETASLFGIDVKDARITAVLGDGDAYAELRRRLKKPPIIAHTYGS